MDNRDTVPVTIASPGHPSLEYNVRKPIFCCLPINLGDGLARKRTIRHKVFQRLRLPVVTGYWPLGVTSIIVTTNEFTAIPLPVEVLQLLAAQEMVCGFVILQVPEDNQAPAVSNQDLVRVLRVLPKGFHQFT